jgi:hypothetical protein
MQSNEELKDSFRELFNIYKDNLPEKKTPGQEYASSNLFEFVSQGIADKDVRSVLENIKIGTGKSFIKNAWDSFKDLIRKALGIPQLQQNALTKLMDNIVRASTLAPTERLSGSLFAMAQAQQGPLTKERTIDILRKHHVPITPKEKIVDSFKRFSKDIVKIGKNIVQVSSEQLRNISPKYMHILRKDYDFKVERDMKKHLSAIEPFIKRVEGLKDDDRFYLRYNLFNSTEQFDKAEEILKRNNMWDEYQKVVSVLKEFEDRADVVGMLPTKIPNYFPRIIKDYEGYMGWLAKRSEQNDKLDLELKAAEASVFQKGLKLSEEERIKLIVDFVTTNKFSRIPNPRSTLLRKIEIIHPEAMQFYDSLGDSLINHVYDMDNKLAAWEMIGTKHLKTRIKLIKDIRKFQKNLDADPENLKLQEELKLAMESLSDPDIALETGLAQLLNEDKSLGQYDREEIARIIKARFTQKGTSGAVQSLKNAGLLATLGNPLAAITQIGDQAFNIYANKGRAAFGGMMKAFVDKDISGKFNWESALREFSPKTTSRWLDKALSFGGPLSLKGMDIFGKESFLKGRQIVYSKMPLKEFQDTWGADGEILTNVENTWKDLKNNKLEGDALYVLYSDLADFQPINLSETPIAYQQGGNLRILYMLKTFAIKAINSIVRESSGLWKDGDAKQKLQAIQNFVYLTTLLGLTGAGADEIKDIILGREKAMKDHFVDNLVQLTLMSRYNVDKGLENGQFLKTMASGVLPPVAYLDDAISDTKNFLTGDPTFRSLKNVPIGGRIWWDRFTEAGRTAEYNRRRMDILDRVANGESASDLSGEISRFNKNARRFELVPITKQTLKRAKERE